MYLQWSKQKSKSNWSGPFPEMVIPNSPFYSPVTANKLKKKKNNNNGNIKNYLAKMGSYGLLE